jgi:hypothetical protein
MADGAREGEDPQQRRRRSRKVLDRGLAAIHKTLQSGPIAADLTVIRPRGSRDGWVLYLGPSQVSSHQCNLAVSSLFNKLLAFPVKNGERQQGKLTGVGSVCVASECFVNLLGCVCVSLFLISVCACREENVCVSISSLSV